MTYAEFLQAVIAAFVPVVIAIIAAVGGIIAAMVAKYLPRTLDAVEKRTGVMIAAQDRTAIMSAVTTGVGLLQTRLDLKLLRPVDIHPGSPAVVQEAERALARVPDAVAGEPTSLPIVAAMIAARVDTTPRPVVAPVPAPVPLAAGT